MPRHSYNFGPPGSTPSSADPDAIKRAFANELQTRRIARGMNQAELARAAAKFMADGKFGRDLIGPYERAMKLPSPGHLAALARALGVEPQVLLPFQGVPGSTKNQLVSAEMKDAGEGTVWIRINERVTWETGLKIMEFVRSDKKKLAAG